MSTMRDSIEYIVKHPNTTKSLASKYFTFRELIKRVYKPFADEYMDRVLEYMGCGDSLDATLTKDYKLYKDFVDFCEKNDLVDK